MPWVVGLVGIAAAAGAGGVGAILAGVVSGDASITAEQAVVVDRENFTEKDTRVSIEERVVAFNDEGTGFTVASEFKVGEELVLDVPLANVSNDDANAIARVTASPGLRTDIEPFWRTRSRSATPSSTHSTPSPSAVTSVESQISDTIAATSSPDGTAGINPQVSTGTATTSSPGLASSSSQEADASATTTKPSGLPGNTAQSATSSRTTTQPVGASSIASKTSNGTATTTAPSGLAGSVSGRSLDLAATSTEPDGTPVIVVNTASTTATSTKPHPDLPGTSSTSTWYEGEWTVDIDADGTKETVRFVLTDLDGSGTGTAVGSIDISTDDADFGEGTSTLSNLVADTDDDERLTATGTVIRIGDFYSFSVDFDSDGSTASLTSNTWFTGAIGDTDLDGDGLADDAFEAALTDEDSDGSYDKLSLSTGDSKFGEGTGTDLKVDFSSSDNGNDEELGGASTVTVGVNQFEIGFDTTPEDGSSALSLTAAAWFTGALSLDANGDGDKTDSEDSLHWASVDADSDGVYDRLELSLEDDTLNQGATSSGEVTTSGDDETVATSSDVKLGEYTFTVGFAPNPAATSSDMSISSKTWFTGAFTIDADADGSADDTVNYALGDTDSDGLYDTMDLSVDDSNFGETSSGSTLSDGVTGANDDESVTGTPVQLGDHYTFDVAFVSNPAGTSTPASITSNTWFTGELRVDMDVDGATTTDADIIAFALSDRDSDGRYDTLDLSTDDGAAGSSTFGEDSGGALSGQSPRRTGSDDDERLGPGSGAGGGNDGGEADVRLGAYYLFRTASANNPAGTTTVVSITAKTHFEGSFVFDANADFELEDADDDGVTDDIERLFYGLTDTDSNGLYDTIDFSLSDQNFGQSSLGDGKVNSGEIGGSDNDERIEFLASEASPVGNTLIAEDSFTVAPDDKNAEIFTAWAINPGSGDIAADEPDINDDGTDDLDSADSSVADQSIAILHEVDGGTIIRFTALDSWRIDADGDELADDHVFFVLSMTGSTGIIDTIDISIGDTTFGETTTGTLSDATVDSDIAGDNTNDERFSCSSFPCSKVVTLGTHPFLVAFDSDLSDSDDARITARWYTGTFPVDVDNDRVDNTLDFVLLDPNSDGLFTVAELDGDDSGGFDATEVHESAGERWFRPVVADAGEDNHDVGRHAAIDALDEDTIFIVYYDGTDGDLLFTKTANAGLDWSAPVTIDDAGDVGRHASLVALDASTILVSYYDATNGDLKAAKSADGGGTWAVTVVDDPASGGADTTDVGLFTDIAATGADAYISYHDETTGALKVARSSDTGASWPTLVTVDGSSTSTDIGPYSSISVLEDGDTTYVSYYDAGAGALKVARTTSGGTSTAAWSSTTVDGSATTSDVGQFTSIVALRDSTADLSPSPGDTVFVSYYDVTRGALRFARTRTSGTTTGAWTKVTVDGGATSTDIGKYSAISAAEENTVWIAYYDADEKNLRVARTTTGGGTSAAWSEVVVDGSDEDDGEEESVGRFASLASFRTHEVFAAYYDEAEGDLRFAKSRLLVDLEGHRMSLQYAMNPAGSDTVTLTNGRILKVAQLGPDEWLFEIPRDAGLGPNIEQSQIRVVVQVPDGASPGFSEIRLDVVQRD